MAGVWELAEDLVNSITFVVEYVVFTLFIYEEAMQMMNRRILDEIRFSEKSVISFDIKVNHTFIMNHFSSDFNNYGILALYACNAYSSYLFASMMVKEWGQLFCGGDRINYSFRRTGLF